MILDEVLVPGEPLVECEVVIRIVVERADECEHVIDRRRAIFVVTYPCVRQELESFYYLFQGFFHSCRLRQLLGLAVRGTTLFVLGNAS